MPKLSDFSPDEIKPLAPAGGLNLSQFHPDEIQLADTGGDIINEMHPDFTVADREIVKNLGTNIDDSIAYLQKQHPDLDIKQESGEIVARKAGETQYRKLDPDSWASMLSPSELAMDAADVAYDVGSGVGSTAATAAGGLAGNLPGAAAAGAASSAGLEGLRQYLGKALGVNSEVSGSDVALAGGLGAVTPLLFGSGAVTQDAAKAAANRGLLSRVGGKIGELTSGIRSDIIDYAGEHLPKFKLGGLKVAAEGPSLDSLDDAIKSFATEGRGQVEEVLEKAKLGAGKAIEDTVDQIKTPIDLTPARLVFDKEIGRVSSHLLENPNEALQAQLDFLIKKKQGLLGDATAVSGRYAWEAQKSLEALGDMANSGDQLADRRMARTIFSAAGELKKQLNEASGGTLGMLNKQAQDHYNLIEELKPFLKDDKSFVNKLSSIQSPRNRTEYQMLEGLDKVYGTDLLEKAKLLTAHKHFSKAGWLAQSAEGTTSTSRTVPLSAMGAIGGAFGGANAGIGQGGAIAGGFIGGLLGGTVGGPKAIRAYMQTARNAKFIEEQARKLSGGLPVGRAAAMGVWNAMNKGGEQ